MGNRWFAWMKHFNSSMTMIRYLLNSQYLLANFSHNENNLFFTQFSRFVLGHQIENTSSITKLQEHVNIIAIISIFNWRIIDAKYICMSRKRALNKFRIGSESESYQHSDLVFCSFKTFRALYQVIQNVAMLRYLTNHFL